MENKAAETRPLPPGLERGTRLASRADHVKAEETDPSRGGGDERHEDSQVHGVD